jgi:cyanophycinase
MWVKALRQVLAVVGVCFASSLLVGNLLADNRPELPDPPELPKPGSLMLHGGGRVTLEAFDSFVNLAGGPTAKIVVIPSAGYRAADFETPERFTAALNRNFKIWTRLPSLGKATSVELLHTEDPRDADDESFIRPLTTATGVWFSGGDQLQLTYRYAGNHPQQTRFQEALRGVWERGGIVGGTSAGMAAMPQIMTLSETSYRGEPSRAVVGHGFGLLTNTIVEQHFDGRTRRFERFFGLLRDEERLDALAGRDGAGARTLGLAVEEATALVLQANHLSVIGNGNAHVFIKSLDQSQISWHTLAPQAKAQLHYDDRGQATLIRN